MNQYSYCVMTQGLPKTRRGLERRARLLHAAEVVIGDKGSDVAIVGRGIYKADDPAKAAADYAAACWDAYTKRLAA